MKLDVILSAALMLVAQPASASSVDWRQFQKPLREFGINDADEGFRQSAFEKNVKFIEEFQKKNPDSSFSIGLNGLALMTDEEYRAFSRGVVVDKEAGTEAKFGEFDWNVTAASKADLNLPATVDWRDPKLNPRGVKAVGSIKKQGKCGACWAFASASLVEGQYAVDYRRDVTPDSELSVQQLVDCAGSFLSCMGGHFHWGLNYAKNKGLRPTNAYRPFNDKRNNCDYNGEPTKKINSWTEITCDQDKMKAALVEGPVGAYVDVSCKEFEFYKGGVFNKHCGDDTGHAVLVVGYTQKQGKDVWIIKNTFGTEWGERGYMYMDMTKIGTKCGLCHIAGNAHIVRGVESMEGLIGKQEAVKEH